MWFVFNEEASSLAEKVYWIAHQYATRTNKVRMVHPKYQTHKNCLRYFLPVLIRETPDQLLAQMFRFTISTFKSNLKKYYINQYPAVCMKHVCQPCGRLPYWTPHLQTHGQWRSQTYTMSPITSIICLSHQMPTFVSHAPPPFFSKKERNYLTCCFIYLNPEVVPVSRP